jgi:hypothetical protein
MIRHCTLWFRTSAKKLHKETNVDEEASLTKTFTSVQFTSTKVYICTDMSSDDKVREGEQPPHGKIFYILEACK